jgi:hypothetical protein
MKGERVTSQRTSLADTTYVQWSQWTMSPAMGEMGILGHLYSFWEIPDKDVQSESNHEEAPDNPKVKDSTWN